MTVLATEPASSLIPLSDGRGGDADRDSAGAGARSGAWRCQWVCGSPGGIAGPVRVPVVLVVDVAVLVLQALVGMLVLVPLGEMQPEARAPSGAPATSSCAGHRLAEQHDGEHGADEGREREIGAGAGGAEMAQRQHEQHQADAVAEEADHAGRRAACRRRAGVRPAASASTRLTAPATRPLIMAICTGSAADSLRVRLLSMPQARQAPAMSKAPQSRPTPPPCQDSSDRAGEDGERAQQAGGGRRSRGTPARRCAMVARPSRLSSSEAAGGRRCAARPSISSTGPDDAAGRRPRREPRQVGTAQRRLARQAAASACATAARCASPRPAPR